MNKKTKFLLVSLCAVFLVAASVLGTLAFLTDKEEAVNTFTVGKVDINLDEADVNADGTIIEGADRVKGNEYHMIPGHKYTKDPTVTVLDGSEECYVRMLLILNEQAAWDSIYSPDIADLKSIFGGYDDSKWIFVAPHKHEGDNRIYEFRYHEVVNTPNTLEPLFTSFTVPSFLDSADVEKLNDFEIKVIGHAIQADGFDDADAAWAAFDQQMANN